MMGKLIGIARRPARRAPMEEIEHGEITVDGGLAGDHKGPKFPKRRITVLSREDWEAALAALSPPAGPADLPWTVRRANLLVEDIRLPRARGGQIQIGPVVLEITYPTVPCRRMEEAHSGLLKALMPEWRGGITARVLAGGPVSIGDRVTVLLGPPDEPSRRLPG